MNFSPSALWPQQVSLAVAFNGILCLVFILVLSHNYRLVPEDYYALQGNHRYGVFEQARLVCNQWGGRYFSYLFSFILLYFYEKGMSYAWYFLAGHVMVLWSFYSIISYICNRLLVRIKKSERFLFSLLMVMTLFYLTPGINESWFWVAASPSYYWGLVMAITGIGLLSRKKISWHHLLAAAGCFLYTGSASEPFALMILFFSATALTWFIYNKNIAAVKPWLVVFTFSLAGFLVMYLSKGTADRWMAMPDFTLPTKVKRCAAALVKYYMDFVPSLTARAFLFSPVFFLTGIFLTKTNIVLPKTSFPKFILFVILAYSAIIFLGFSPSCFVMGEAGPLRSWHHTGLYNLFFVAGFFIYSGNHYGPLFLQKITQPEIPKLLFSALLIVISILHFIYLSKQVGIVLNYSKAVDERMALLMALQEKKYKGLLILKKLPDSGLLFSAEIDRDEDFYLNTFLEKGSGLDFKVKAGD